VNQGLRVSLRELAEEDAPLVVRWRSDPAVASELFSERPPSLREHLAWFRALGPDRREFMMVTHPENMPIGTVGLSRIDRRHGHAEFGILVGEPAFRGKGYAMEAAALLLDMAFGPLGLHRVYLHVFPENVAAIRLYERVGFVKEGCLRQHVKKGGALRDAMVMGLLSGEWKSIRSRF